MSEENAKRGRGRDGYFVKHLETWTTENDGTRDLERDDWRVVRPDFDALGSPADYRLVEVQAAMGTRASDLDRWPAAEAKRPKEERADPTLIDMVVMAWNDPESTGKDAIISRGLRAVVRLDEAGQVEASIGSERTAVSLITVAKREKDDQRSFWRFWRMAAETPFARSVVRFASQRPTDEVVPAVGSSGVMASHLSRFIGDTPMSDYRGERRISRAKTTTRRTSDIDPTAPVEVVVRLDEDTRGEYDRKRRGQLVFGFHNGEAKGSEEDLVFLAVDALQALDTDAHKSMLVFMADAAARGGRACLDARLLKQVRIGTSKKASSEQWRRFEEHTRLAQRIAYEVEKADGSDWRRGVFFVATEWQRDGSPTRFDLAGRILDEVVRKRKGIPFPMSLVRLDGKRQEWTYRIGMVLYSRAALGSAHLERSAVEEGRPGEWRDGSRRVGDLLAQTGVLNARKMILDQGAPKVRTRIEQAFDTLRDGWPDLVDGQADPAIVDYRIDWNLDDILASPIAWTYSPAVRLLNLERRSKALNRAAAAGRKALAERST